MVEPLEDRRKIRTAYNIYQICGLKGLLLKMCESTFSVDPRADYPRQHIRYLSEKQGLRIAEIGVWKGYHSNILQKQLDIKKMYLIDPYESYEDYEESKSNIDRMSDAKKTAHDKLEGYESIEWIELYSNEAAKKIDGYLDYVYIDGNHEYEFVKDDIERYYKLVKGGGVIAGHDYSTSWPGVVQAVEEFSNNKNLNVHTEPRGNDWYIMKPN